MYIRTAILPCYICRLSAPFLVGLYKGYALKFELSELRTIHSLRGRENSLSVVVKSKSLIKVKSMGLYKNKHPYSPLCCSIVVMLQLSHVSFKTKNWMIPWPLIAQLLSCSPLCSSSAHWSMGLRRGWAQQALAPSCMLEWIATML